MFLFIKMCNLLQVFSLHIYKERRQVQPAKFVAENSWEVGVLCLKFKHLTPLSNPATHSSWRELSGRQKASYPQVEGRLRGLGSSNPGQVFEP